MRVRAIATFVWAGRDVDLGDEFEVSPRDADLLIRGYRYAVLVEGELVPPASMTVTSRDPVVAMRDPVALTPGRKRRS